MNYPLLSEYIESIKAAEDNFEQLKHLRPILGEDGEPVMSSGNFAVVFKMKDEQTGILHAVKCFLKEQEGRAEAYRQIAEELEYVSSTFLTPIKYLDNELFVDSSNSEDSEFPVLLMDWVEGQTLDKYIREHIDDQYELSLLAYQFSRLAMWLMPQPFAHGDLKPDNILVKDDGTLVLVDYDGMYVPAMKGQKARELGSPDFRHPSRTEEVFDEHIDDFSLASILLSMKAIALQPSLLEEYGASDRLLFSEKDYRNLSESNALGALQPLMQDSELASLYSLYILALSQNNLSQVSFRLFNLKRPDRSQYEEENLSTEITDEDLADAWTDEFGVMYSRDRKRLLGVYGDYLPDYEIPEGTKVICNEALNGFWSEIEGLMISGKITIPSSVRFIGRNPFRGDYDTIISKSPHFVVENGALYTSNKKRLISCFSKESEFVIPEGVEQIGSFAFYNCNFTRIVIPESVSYIGDNPFIEMNLDNNMPLEVICYSHRFFVKENAIYQNNPQRLISYWGKSLLLYIEDGTLTITPFSFYNGVRLIYLPLSVQNIHEEAFWGYSQDPQKILIPMNSIEKFSQLIPQYKDKLIEVDLSKEWLDEFGARYSADRKRLIRVPYNIDTEEYHVKNGTEIICEEAFMWCEIKEVSLPSTIKEIGDVAFFGCKYLNSILIPDSLDKLGDNPFANCPSLNIIDCRTDKLVFENGVLYSSDRKHLISYFRKDYEFTIPDSVEVIGNRAFLGCDQLVSVIIQNSVTKIGVYSFCACRNLKHITMPDSIKEIGACAFRDCVSLDNTIIPDSVVKMGNGVFAECKALKNVFVKDYVKEVEGSLFLGCNNLSRIIVPNGKKGRFENNNFGGITIIEEQDVEKYSEEVTDEDLTNAWTDEFGVKYSADRKKLLRAPRDINEYSVREGTKVICNNAFTCCESIVSLTMPDSVVEIGEFAFEWCDSLTSIIISKNITIIQEATFYACNSLVSVDIPTNVKTIGSGAFFKCGSLEEIIIPKNVTSIGEGTFKSCTSLKTIYIKNANIDIDSSAFSNCDNLNSLYIPLGSKKKFEELLPKYKNKLVEQERGWSVKDTRPFSPDEIAAVKRAEVVASQYGSSVCFFMNSGGQTYIPLLNTSSLTVGDSVDLKTAKLVTLCREGEDDIYRVVE